MHTICIQLSIVDGYLSIYFCIELSIGVDAMDMKHYKDWIKIGLNILYYRKERRLTQEDLADACKKNRTFIQRIETGVSSCSLDTLMDIANALNIPLYKLFVFKD